MEIRLLGPLEVWRGNEPLFFPRRQQRLILGILALESNHVVALDRLIDLLWGDRPPTHARSVVQTRVSELRTILGVDHTVVHEPACVLTRHGDGYMLKIDSEVIDANRFRRLVVQARAADGDAHARALLREATRLWRGPALGGWLARDSHAALCHGLESLRITALEDLFDLELRLGHARDVVDELLEACVSDPQREQLTTLTMVALHRCGRTPEALHTYDRYRRLLRLELGVDPGDDLKELHVRILRGDPTLIGEPSMSGDATRPSRPASPEVAGEDGFPVRVPRLLPGDIADFTGRQRETELLAEFLSRGGGDGLPVVAVAGPPGVGKTALCVHAAHRLRDRFPDGQLYADLHGFDREAPPPAAEILARFLRALGVESALPDALDERSALYRDLLAGRRVLVVLDNAGDADQVRPLIPGSPTCAVLVNSRLRLAPAISAEAVDLRVLDPAHAVDLLSRIAGRGRVDIQPAAAAELVRICGGLPLAIRVAAARLAARPQWTVQHLVNRLSDERQRLDQLAYRNLDVRSSIALSYRGLSNDAGRLLRRLGDIDTPEVNVWCSAALLDTHVAQAEETLEQLHDAQLLDVAGIEGGGYARYRPHDLVRLYAKERATADEEPAELAIARDRAFGAWMYVLDEVYRRAIGNGMTSASPAPRWPVDSDLLDAILVDPMAWFDRERLAIASLVRRAARDGRGAECWGLACTASPLFQIRSYFDEWAAILEAAHAATTDLGDEFGTAAVLFRLGMHAADQQAHQHARDRFQAAAARYRHVGDPHGLAMATTYTAMMDRLAGELDGALTSFEQALPGLRNAGDHLAEAFTLRSIGQVYMQHGDFERAETYLDRALLVAQQSGSLRTEAQVYFWQGMLRREQQRHLDAKLLFARVLDATRRLGDRGGEAQALRGLGLCHGALGEIDQAAAMFNQALPLVRHPQPSRIETLLRNDLAALTASAVEPSAG